MKRVARVALVCLSACLLLIAGASWGAADSSLEETKQLLQKGLTLAQIDQEIDRLTQQETQVAAQLDRAGTQIAEKDVQVADTREHAGKVLRAYYMGDRPTMWTLVFSSKSFADAIAVIQYMSMVIENDQRTLGAYQTSYQELKQLQAKLLATQTELKNVKAEFIAQRDRQVALQQELEAQLAAQPEVKEQIDKLTNDWKTVGVPMFRKYFQGISEAMGNLPVMSYLKLNSWTQYTFQITDQQLGDFFRSQNAIFNNVAFRFDHNRFIVSGADNGTKLAIEGHYEVIESPNRLKFVVDQLGFNDLTLDYTFNRSLEEEFDLGFNPEKYLAGAKATAVTMQDGKLTIDIEYSKPKPTPTPSVTLNTPNKP